MADPLIQEVSWAGSVFAVESFSYSVVHGISPGLWRMTTIPREGDDPPLSFGDLRFSDGQREVILKDCKADKITPSVGPDGTTWVIEGFDRRWRWAGYRVSGIYNEREKFSGKLVPWAIRSPEEICKLCLDAMGEKDYLIDVPVGLGKADGANLDDYLKLGENLQEVNQTNPPVEWDNTPPAAALVRFLEPLGRRLVFQPVRNRVVIVKIGEGGDGGVAGGSDADLPDAPCEAIAATVDEPETPSLLGVAGAKILYQCRLLLEPVGDDFGEVVLPIDDLSFKPVGETSGGAVQTTTVTHTGSNANQDVSFEISTQLPDESVPYVFKAFESDGGVASTASKLASVASQINAYIKGRGVTASASGQVLTIKGTVTGRAFGVIVNIGPNDFKQETVLPKNGSKLAAWATCWPPDFSDVQGTDRFTKPQAQEFARRSVWRKYRVVVADPATGKPPLKIPGYDKEIKRRQQIVLTDFKVERVTPQPREAGGTSDPQAGAGILPDFYTGTERSAGAEVFGSVAREIGAVLWDNNDDPNTDPTSKVYVGFRADPDRQLIAFDGYVYTIELAGDLYTLRKPRLVLEAAVYIRDEDTGAFSRYEKTRDFGGRGAPVWQVCEDVRVGVVGQYDQSHNRTGGVFQDFKEAEERADFYLDRMAEHYELVTGETRRYIGIYAIDPDGKIQNVSWTIGGAGPTTVASTNSEHDPGTLPYNARVRVENLPPNVSAAVANVTAGKLPDPIGVAANILRRL
jgi:hypothetical protein